MSSEVHKEDIFLNIAAQKGIEQPFVVYDTNHCCGPFSSVKQASGHIRFCHQLPVDQLPFPRSNNCQMCPYEELGEHFPGIDEAPMQASMPFGIMKGRRRLRGKPEEKPDIRVVIPRYYIVEGDVK